jgi:monofunctional biosynthetic peptidoglycan transglycosylase
MTSSGSSRKTAIRWVRRLVAGLAVLLLLPYLLTPLYRVVDPPSTLMLARWLLGRPVERVVVPLDRVAPVLPRTVIASEDGRFCRHHGIDLAEMREAWEDADDISELRGGSTITQQVAKNLFLWSGRSYVRKGLEFPLALWIDLILPKERVLELYLNIAEWGPSGQFGVDAGANYAFGRSAAKLSPREAALLAAMLPNPHRRSARKPGPGMRRLSGTYMVRARSVDMESCRSRKSVN